MKQALANHSVEAPLKIRILSGANEGADVPLINGVYSIGKNEDCDLILDDQNLSEHHLDLKINERLATISTLGNEVYIEKNLCMTELQSLKYFDVVMIGSTHFSIGPNDLKWPVLSISDEKYAPEEPPTLSSDQKVDEEEVETLKGNRYEKIMQRLKTIPLLILFVIGLALLIFLFGILFPVQALNSDQQPDDSATQVIQKLNLEGSVRLEHRNNGQPYLTGYVEDEEMLKTLKSQVNDDTDIQVWNQNELKLKVKEILNALNMKTISIRSLKDGNLIVSGYIQDITRWEMAKQILLRDIPGINTIEDSRLKSFAVISQYLHEKINKYALSEWIKINISDDKLVATGAIPEEKTKVWNSIQKYFTKRYGKHIELENKVTITNKRKLHLAVKSISIGEVSYIMLKDNSKYIEGSMIGNGYTLKSIESDRIILSKNNKNIDYLIGSQHD